MSRSLGWILLTTRSPIEIVPEVMFSRPASIRSRVDLPQPDGPTSTTKAPSSIGIVTPCKTSKPPKDFRTSRICTDDINFLPDRLSDHGTYPFGPDLRASYQTFADVSLDQSRRRVAQRPDVAKRTSTCEIANPTKIAHKIKACALREKP